MRYINFEQEQQSGGNLVADDFFMREALKEARIALSLDEVPIGAVVVHQDKIIARGHNLTERLNDVTAHAEMQAFTAAANFIGGKYLRDCTLYVTVEPCVMCAGASFWTQVKRIVYGASDPKRGYSNFGPGLLHPKAEIRSGVLESECGELMRQFFASKRF